MNFLAHLHLADGDPGDMLGGIAADFIRNPQLPLLPVEVQRGVRLHRLIDGFTDRHPITWRSISRVAREAGWYSGIVVDIYYDHILAREWSRYSAEPLAAFAARSYGVLRHAIPELPEDARNFIHMFVESDRLNLYASREGIADTLARVSRVIAKRIPSKPIWLPDMMPLLVARDAEIAADFHAFYPELMAFVTQQRELK